MSVKLKPIDTIEARLEIEPNGKIQKFFTNTCKKRMDKYVPMDTGALRRNVTLTSDTITYESNYAHAQFVGIVNGGEVKNYTTPGTGPYWSERMWSAEKDEVVKEVQKKIDRG